MKQMKQQSPKGTMCLLIAYVVLLFLGFTAPAMHYSIQFTFNDPDNTQNVEIN